MQWNESTQTFTFPQVTDSLSLSGDRSNAYTVTVTYETVDYDGVTRSSTDVQFDLTIKNPCIDQSYVTIQAPTFTKKTYIIDSGSFDFPAED